jgi:transcriptional regulator with XRE-family HTH domain
MKTLGEQAKAFRESKGWNSAQMAKASHTSRQNIESLEQEGNRIPKYIGHLAVAMGRSVDSMLVEAGLAPAALVRKAGADIAEWPLKMVDQDRYELLDDVEKGFAQAEMMRAIKECEDKRKLKPSGKSSGPASNGTHRKAA